MNLTTQDQKFLTALKVTMPDDKRQSLAPAVHTPPDKATQWSMPSLAGHSDVAMVPMSAVEELCVTHRIVEDNLVAERAMVALLEGKLAKADDRIAKLCGDNASLRLKFAAAFGVAVIASGWLAYAEWCLAVGR